MYFSLKPMELEPKSLGVPLYRRSWSGAWFVLASMGCAWLWHKPTDVLGIAISCLVGGFVFWLALGPGLNALKFHSSVWVRGLTFITSVVGTIFVMQRVIPFLNHYVGSRL
jgi:hypothetical protein